MRLVGILIVLAACAAIQLPWFSCHSDCRHAYLPVWDLGVHACHDEDAHRRAVRECPCCPGHGRAPDPADGTDAGEDGDDHDHGPGDHELLLQSSRRPASSDAVTIEVAPSSYAVHANPADETLVPLAIVGPAPGAFDTGPPDRLASVRLLL